PWGLGIGIWSFGNARFEDSRQVARLLPRRQIDLGLFDSRLESCALAPPESWKTSSLSAQVTFAAVLSRKGYFGVCLEIGETLKLPRLGCTPCAANHQVSMRR